MIREVQQEDTVMADAQPASGPPFSGHSASRLRGLMPSIPFRKVLLYGAVTFTVG